MNPAIIKESNGFIYMNRKTGFFENRNFDFFPETEEFLPAQRGKYRTIM